MKKNCIRKILAAFMAAAVMSSFAAVSIYAEPDMVVEDQDDAELDSNEEEEDPEEEIAPDETPEEEAAPDEAPEEETAPDEATEEETAPDEAPEEETAPDEATEENTETTEESNPEDFPTDDDLVEEEVPSLPEPTYTATGNITMYATTTINVRKGPGTGYDKLGVVYAGGETTVKGYNGEWLAIDYYGGTGYVLGELLTETAPATSTTTAAPVETAPAVEETDATTAETEPVIEDTTVTEIEEEPVVTTTEEETAPTTQPAEEESDEEEEEAAAVTDSSDKKSGGLQGILIAAISALVAFLLIGIVPIVVHRIHHKKIYQY